MTHERSLIAGNEMVEKGMVNILYGGWGCEGGGCIITYMKREFAQRHREALHQNKRGAALVKGVRESH